ncbi:MAG: geranylgeranyl reductase family protein [Acidimicrobiales bacterium]|nr:geranylgeranyl reductase family protein [Acidimicrobiales bacterium]
MTDQHQRADVVVVGAGPAGAAAAISLARAGRDVIVVDKAAFPRDKCCGDGLTALALRLSERLGLDPTTIPSWMPVDAATVSGPPTPSNPRGHSVRFPLPPGPGVHAAVARRSEYDAALVDLARRAGATVLEGHALQGATEEDDRVTLDVAGVGRLHTRYVVAADGMWSPTRKALGLGEPGYRGEWHAFRAYFRDVSEQAQRELFVLFETDLLPGYAWSFPVGDGTANFGFGVQRGAKVAVGEMRAVWDDLLQRPRVREILGPDAVAEARHTAWPIPARIDRLPRTGRRTFFVGDAAAATDVMTGEGIGQALLTGMLAAEAIESTGPHGARVATARYDDAVDHHLVADHRMSALLVRGLRHRRAVRAAVRVAGSTPWTRRNFARWLFEDYPRAVAVTPSRWHAGMFHGPGAFADTPLDTRTASTASGGERTRSSGSAGRSSTAARTRPAPR